MWIVRWVITIVFQKFQLVKGSISVESDIFFNSEWHLTSLTLTLFVGSWLWILNISDHSSFFGKIFRSYIWNSVDIWSNWDCLTFSQAPFLVKILIESQNKPVFASVETMLVYLSSLSCFGWKIYIDNGPERWNVFFFRFSVYSRLTFQVQSQQSL